MTTPAIILHHLEQSRSHRILWLLEELGLPYEMKVYRRDKEMRAPPSLREVHPLGRAPVVEVDGEVFAESGAIIETLVERFAPQTLAPAAGTPAFRHYRYFLHYAEGSLMPPLLVGLITGKMRTAPVPFFIKPIIKSIASQVDASYTTPEVKSHAAFVEQHLAANAFFAGEAFSAADIQMVYGIEALVSRGGVPVPACARWLAAMNERPAARRALEKGGPMMPA